MATLSAPPAAGQTISYNGKEYTTVKEGLAYILVPANARTSLDPKPAPSEDDKANGTESQSVFYNPIQQFNRDLSVLAIRAYGEHVVAFRTAEREARVRKFAERGHRKRGKRKGDGVDVGEGGGGEAVDGNKRRKIGEDKMVKVGNGSVEGTETAGNKGDNDLLSKTEEGDSIVVETVSQEQPAVPGERGAANNAVNSNQQTTPQWESTAGAPEPKAEPRPANGANQCEQWRPRFRILDALSATGLRALRYAKEIPFATSITANDLSQSATEAIQVNVLHNRLEDKIKITTSNASAHMYGLVYPQPSNRSAEDAGKYDVIDLDPYGTAVPFLDAALQALQDGGLLCVTCTDAGVFASTGYAEKTYSLYGGLPSKGPHCHEVGLRLIVHAIASTAARYGLAAEPLLALSIDFYARVFVRVRKSAADVKFLAGKTMTVYNCDAGCGAWTTQFLARNHVQQAKNGAVFYKHSLAQAPTAASKCEHCGFKTHLSGPMWGGPLHNPAFLERILGYLPDLDRSAYATIDRIEGMLSMALEETISDSTPKSRADSTDPTGQRAQNPALIPAADPWEVDHHPFFFIPSMLAKVLHCQSPSEAQIRGALIHSGYRVTRSHTKPGSIRTDAPWSVVWEVMREWVRQKAPIKDGAIRPGTAGWRIMGMSDARKVQGAQVMPVDADQGVDERNGTTTAAPEAGSTREPKETTVVFDEKLGKEQDNKKLIRFQLNPRANWGPMTRARGS